MKAICFAATAALLGLVLSSESPSTSSQKKDAPLERARREVKMLDDIYKGGVVLITKHYVHDDDDLPAGTAFKKLFESAKKAGWHEVRLLDATGQPYSDENVAEDAFEKKGIKELLKGKSYYEEVVRKGDKRYLRAVTAIPVVMDKCVMCHDNYSNIPEGQAIGALGYTMPVVEDADLWKSKGAK